MGIHKTARLSRAPAVRSDPLPLRAWHIVMADGGDQTVTAHRCGVDDGVLSFTRSRDDVIVRAFAPRAWHDVDLVDTNVTAVHQPPFRRVTHDED